MRVPFSNNNNSNNKNNHSNSSDNSSSNSNTDENDNDKTINNNDSNNNSRALRRSATPGFRWAECVDSSRNLSLLSDIYITLLGLGLGWSGNCSKQPWGTSSLQGRSPDHRMTSRGGGARRCVGGIRQTRFTFRQCTQRNTRTKDNNS